MRDDAARLLLLSHRMTLSVLVVDDDPAIRGMVAEFLSEEGYAVDTAAHGGEALEAVRSTRPSAIVLDALMPVMDGWQFLDACHKEGLCESTPVIVVSAVPESAELAAQHGARAYCGKPFSLIELESHIRSLTNSAAQRAA